MSWLCDYLSSHILHTGLGFHFECVSLYTASHCKLPLHKSIQVTTERVPKIPALFIAGNESF